jgi:hypothetical protein
LVTTGGADSNGDFTAVGGLPDGTFYLATTNSAGYADQLYDGFPHFDDMDVTIGTPIEIYGGVAPQDIEFHLNAGCTIAGTVTGQASGQALPGIEIILHDAAGAQVASCTSDINGAFSSNPSFPAGTYFARTLSSPEILDQLYDGMPCDGGCDTTTGTPIILAHGDERLDIDFVLTQHTLGVIEGTITESSTGAALTAVWVRVFDSEGQQVAMVSSSVDGSYSTADGLEPGTYFLRTENYDGYFDELYDDILCSGGCDPTNGTPVAVSYDQTVSGIDFALSKGALISGTVTDVRTGLGIANIVVEFYDSNGNFVTEDFTDSNGNYVSRNAVHGGTYFSKTDSVWTDLEYVNMLYDGHDCSDGCDVTTGTPIVVVTDQAVTGIDYVLREKPLFEDGFESGDCEQWSSVVGMN